MIVRPRLAAALAAMLAALPAAAEEAPPDAGCADLLAPGAAEAAIRDAEERALVQRGLRAVFAVERAGLADGIIGPVSRSYLERLCRAVPLPADVDPVEGTVALAREYGALAERLPDWTGRIAAPGLLEGSPGRLLHLTGPAAAKAAALEARDATPATCDALEPLALPPDAAALGELEAGLAALAGSPAPPDRLLGREAELRSRLRLACALYPTGLDEAALVEALRRLGRLAARVPAAAELLRGPELRAWIAEAQGERLLRLAGTPESAAALLAESGIAAAEAPPPPLACARIEREGPEWFALTAEDLDRLTARTAVTEALAPLAEQRFADRSELVAAINAAVGVAPPDCAVLIAEGLVARHEAESQVHLLDPAAFQQLALDPRLAPVLPALEPLVGLESTRRETVVARLGAAIDAVVSAAAEAEIVAAADAAAAAAEEVEPVLDLAAIALPPERLLGPRQEFAITDPSLVQLRAEVTDPELFDAISGTEYEQVAGRPVVRARVLAALRPIAEGRIAETTGIARAAAEAAVVTRYRLIEPVVAGLAAEPDFAAVSPDLIERIGRLEGIAYPTERLFERALAGIVPPVDGVARAAVDAIGRRVADPQPRRQVAPIAADCGCVASRYEFDSLVYAFYPFWSFGEAGDAAAEPPKVDFELVERIAFDGLEIGPDGRLRHAPRWTEAAGTFVVSARRHLATVDLAVRLRGWRDWSDAQIEDAAFALAAELGARRHSDPLQVSAGPFGWLDRLIDRRPDGVTLIVEGYSGAPGEPSARNLVALVRALAGRLAGQTINLAFDIPLVGAATARDPLFQDLREVILPVDPLRPKLVERVLVFVERPTAEAKKLLRARLENSFAGEDRWTVLRHLVPVVPPGGNAGPAHEGEMLVLAGGSADFGQFHDDVLYFQDNFGGIGFWPAPEAGAADRVAAIVRAEFDTSLLPAFLRPYSAEIGGVCRFVCPNRYAFYLGAMAAGGLVLAVRGLSLYSRRVRGLAEAVFVTPLMLLALMGLLLAVALCDRSAEVWAPAALIGLAALLGTLGALQWYGRRLDGPIP